MTLLFFLEIGFFLLAIIATVLFIICVFSSRNYEPDYQALYKMMVEQEEEHLITLNTNNKKIDEYERKILICKKKLGWKLFKDSN